MFKIIQALFFLMFSCAALSAQVALGDFQIEGTILTKKGDEKGILWVNGGPQNPWDLQKKVFFMPEKKYLKAKKLKKKDFDKYGPKDIKGYQVYERVFLSRKYSEGATMGVSLLSVQHFLEALVQGKMTVFRYYDSPDAVGALGAKAQQAEESINNPVLIIEMEGEKMKPVNMVNFYEILESCPVVYEKYETGGYGFIPKEEEKKGKGLKGMFNRAMETEMNDFVLDLAKDYNQECGSGQ